MVRIPRRRVLIAGAAAAVIPTLARAGDGGSARGGSVNMHQVLKAAAEHSASEVLLTTGAPPFLRIKSETVPFKVSPLTPIEVKQLAYSVLTEAQKQQFEATNALRMSFGVKGLSRFRMLLNLQRGAVSATLRVIPYRVPPLDKALTPVTGWIKQSGGLYLLAGKPDSGRTTALAGLVEAYNVAAHGRVITLEDPIEFLVPHRNSVVEQIEDGTDAKTPAEAAQRAVQAHPDVIAWDFPQNHVEEIVELINTGVLVLATWTAASPKDALDSIGKVDPKAKSRVAGIAQLDLSAPKGKDRALSVKVL